MPPVGMRIADPRGSARIRPFAHANVTHDRKFAGNVGGGNAQNRP